MRNLLSANFQRLKKSGMFWGTMALSFAYGCGVVCIRYRDAIRYGEHIALDSVLFLYALLAGFVSAVFTALFFGSEYSDGTIRNKLIAGKSRLSIYLNTLVTSFIVSVLASCAYIVAVLALGIPLLEAPVTSVGEMLLNFLGSLTMEAAFCAIYTAVTMNCSKKAVSAVCCILLVLAMFLGSAYIQNMLAAPEFRVNYLVDEYGQLMTDQEGNLMLGEPEPNPHYLHEEARRAYEFAADLIPSGQSYKYCAVDTSHPFRLVLCALGEVVLFTGGGAAIFKRKDLK